MNKMMKRILSLLLTVVLVLPMIPAQTNALEAATNPMTVTVNAENGTPITGATITAIAQYKYSTSVVYDLQTAEQGSGKYTVYRGSRTASSYNIIITITAPGYEDTTVTVSGRTTSTIATMTPAQVVEEWQPFNMYYYLNGSPEDPYPSDYAAPGEAGNYGPSRDNTPFATINVNVAKLRTEYADVVVYTENSSVGNQFQYTPVNSADRKAAVAAFWQAVLACADEASIAALHDTGLYDWYSSYVLKKQADGSQHCDGVLEVKPPVYSIELYKNDIVTGGSDSYVGGLLINDGEPFKTVDEVLTTLEGYLGYTITWQEENGKPVATNGVYTGTFIHERHLHTITVLQSNADQSQDIAGSEIPFERISNYYYLARFELTVEEKNQVEFIVKYTDGDANGTAFYEHSYGVKQTGATAPLVPAFDGQAVREGYTFLGWILEGGDGTILSDAQVQAMRVTEDMVFHAEWEPIPLTYVGAIHVILNGTYNAENQTATGTYIDINAVAGTQVVLYVKEENSNSYIQMEPAEGTVGVYQAILENGNYTIHYSLDGGNTIKDTDGQYLTIDNADRVRYLFYNSVDYNLNGGEAAEDFPSNYYQTGMRNIYVLPGVPTRDRYVFSHWEDQYGNTYAPGDLLTAQISQPYTLTAQWKDAFDVYVKIEIDHEAEDGGGQNHDKGMYDIFFTLDRRSGTGDYTEIYTKDIQWDGTSSFEDPVFQLGDSEDVTQNTHYVSYVPVLENVDASYEYTFTTNKPGYTLKEVNRESLNGDLIIIAKLIFDPNDFDFTFKVSLDEEAKALPSVFKPVAANVKVTAWSNTPNDEDYGLPEGDPTLNWYAISQHRFTYERVVLDENGEGFGTFPVWMTTTDSDTPATWHYRIEVVSYEMPDGSINPATDVNKEHTTYISDCGHVEANIHVTGGKSPEPDKTELHGAYYADGKQNGEIEAIISIHTYSVTFDPNGGTLNGSQENTVVEPLFQIPNLTAYVPVRDGGYVFDGWYYADDNGQMTDDKAESFTPLHQDVVLIAKWREPRAITANVAVDTSYTLTNPDGSVSVHMIHGKARAQHVNVALQKIMENGYPETVEVRTVELTYEDHIGFATTTFTQVPDDGHTYRILVIAHNYTFTYQNEPESLYDENRTDYAGSYNTSDFIAEFGEDALAVVNSYGSLTPDEFALKYQVDAQAIGTGFRPESVQILFTHDDDAGERDPSKWPVISQMEFGETQIGIHTPMADGFGEGVYQVWRSYPDGRTAEYALQVQSTLQGGVNVPFDPDTAPFTATYRVPAYFVEPNGQSQILVATLTPKQYPVTYEVNGGTMPAAYPQVHTWSYQTDLSGVVPARAGYIFDGWYLDAELTQPAGDSIGAEVCQETVLYAKWKLAQDRVNVTVTIDHMQGNDPQSSSGQAAAYDRILYIQLSSHEDGGEGVTYIPVDGTVKAFNSDYWHTMEDGTPEEVFSISNIYYDLPSDMAYNAIASMEGYILIEEKCTVTPASDEDSETGTIYDVELYLEYHPELLNIDFTVRMDENVDPALDPVAAQVKVTSWYDQPDVSLPLGWHQITQHQENYLTVALDEQTRSGSGSYQVWQWYLQEQGIPFYYRIEVVGLLLKDGTVVPMQEQEAEVSYTGSIYTATVYADNGAEVPIPQDELHNTTLTGVLGVETDSGLVQKGTLEAVITVSEPVKVVFHANNAETLDGNDIFRTYYSAGAVLPDSNSYSLNGYGQVGVFYDIPSFDYTAHNGYIFKGWYMGPEEDAAPMDWNASYNQETHIYAHWIEVGEVEREEDGKIYVYDYYSEYDLVGAQIRTAEQNPGAHYGEAGAGLRFVSSLSERIYNELNNLHLNNNPGIEYGFAIAKTTAADAMATGEDYMLKYKHATINGEDTTSSYSYVMNTPCRVPNKEVDDHFAGIGYRLYTAVITYKNLSGDRLTAAQNTYFISRSYLRYFDVNGLERIHYNNYTGPSATYGGVNTCYSVVHGMVSG